MLLKKIISGGQTGADQGALLGANKMLVSTGGYAPKGWRTERGPNPRLGTMFGLRQAWSSKYPLRTRLNVQRSDGTLWIGSTKSPGARLTLSSCRALGKPVKIVKFKRVSLPNSSLVLYVRRRATDIVSWIRENRIRVLNVAGNRESQNYGVSSFAELLVSIVITELRHPGTLSLPIPDPTPRRSPRHRRRQRRNKNYSAGSSDTISDLPGEQ